MFCLFLLFWEYLFVQKKISTINYVTKEINDTDLLTQCVNKIAILPNSNEMMIRDAIILCHGGIKMNADNDKE